MQTGTQQCFFCIFAGRDPSRKGRSVAAKYSEFFNEEHDAVKKEMAAHKDRQQQQQQAAAAKPSSAFAAHKPVHGTARRVIIQTMWRAMHATVRLHHRMSSVRHLLQLAALLPPSKSSEGIKQLMCVVNWRVNVWACRTVMFSVDVNEAPIYVHGFQVAIDHKPLFSIMADNFEAAIEVSPEDVESKELLVQCSSLFLLDCSCGLPLYRAAIVIEPGLPDDFAIRTTIQRSRVYYPSNSFKQGSGDTSAEAVAQSPGKANESQPAGRAAGSARSSLKAPKVSAPPEHHMCFSLSDAQLLKHLSPEKRLALFYQQLLVCLKFCPLECEMEPHTK